MSIDLYYMNMSPPSRSVIMTIKSLGLTNVNIKTVDVFKGEHMKEEFIAINPQHCIPTLVDGDLKMCESRAICTYLVSQYGKDDTLYPKDPKKRALVDRMLYFDACTLFQGFLNYAYGKLFEGNDTLDPAKLKKLHEAFGMLNTFLEGQKFAAGEQITVADHVILTTCVSLMAAGLDLSKYSNITSWVNRCKTQMPYFDEAQDGVELFGNFIKSKIEW